MCQDEEDPEPGCSYWVKKNSVPQQHLGDTSSSSVPVNWENKYNELLATHIALLGSLQVHTTKIDYFEVLELSFYRSNACYSVKSLQMFYSVFCVLFDLALLDLDRLKPISSGSEELQYYH